MVGKQQQHDGKQLQLSSEKLALYRRRLENGYDLHDPLYEQWKQQQQQKEGKQQPVQDHLPAVQFARQKPGRVARHIEFPEIVRSAMGFINLHGFSAQARRRTTAGNSTGVTLAQVQQHLLSAIPGLKEKGISRTTVHQLMLPPRLKAINAQRYHGVLSVRVPSKRNDEHGHHQDGHYCLAQVGYMLEFAQQFSDTTATFSCDNKNKINVGTLAVSRYHQIRSFFPVSDAAVYKDHDFPIPKAKVIPSGYLRLARGRSQLHNLKPQCRSASADAAYSSRRNKVQQQATRGRPRSSSQPPSLHQPRRPGEDGAEATCFRRDKLGRLHYSVPHTGYLFVKNRAARFHESTAETHANDLSALVEAELRKGKTGLCLSVDGGPDYTVKSVLTVFAMGRLWRDQNLDFLIMCTHAPGDSAYNRVEHAWSPLSSAVAGVTLPASLPGELPPWEQKLSAEDGEKKVPDVFDHAMEVLNSYWNGLSYDGFPVVSSSVPCLETPSPYSDHGKLSEFMAAGITKVKADEGMKALLKEMQFLHAHAVRKTHMLQFMKCTSKDCSHCSSRPVKSTEAVQFLRSHGGRLMTPRPSSSHEGHFCTFLEAAFLEDAGRKPLKLDFTLPSLDGTDASSYVCDICERYVFQSEADRVRHLQRIHSRQPKRKRKNDGDKGDLAENAEESAARPVRHHICTFSGCGLVFTTHHQLQKHKRENGHKCKAGRKKKT